MSTLLTQIYKDKLKMCTEDLNILYKHIEENKDVKTIDNHDRSVMIEHNNLSDSKLHDIMNSSITKWVKPKLESLNYSPNHLYNILPISTNKVIVKV